MIINQYKYNKKTKFFKFFCPICRYNIDFTIPKQIIEKDHKNYPFTFRHIHGNPPHSITLYIDKNNNIRGTEIGDSIQLSDQIVENMFQKRNITTDTSAIILKTIFNTYTTYIEGIIPESEKINYKIGRKLGNQFEYLFKAKKMDNFFMELADFWKKNSFGEIDEQKKEKDLLSFKVYECFECSHLPILGHPVCKLDESFVTSILNKKFNSNYIVNEVECISTGKDYCKFEVRKYEEKPKLRKIA